jgi:hypothetical protein
VVSGANYLCFAEQPEVYPVGLDNGDTVCFLYVGIGMLKYSLGKLQI